MGKLESVLGPMIHKIVLEVQRAILLRLLGLNYEREGRRKEERYVLTFKNLKKVITKSTSLFQVVNEFLKVLQDLVNTLLKHDQQKKLM